MSELISWEEAEWTRQALGMNNADFARLIGVTPTCVSQGQKKPQSFLRKQPALMLTLAVNRGHKPRSVSKLSGA